MNSQQASPSKRIVAIHQPNHLPWLGYFHKIASCDFFVFLDDAQYTKHTHINRTQVIQNGGPQRVSVPVSPPHWDCKIMEVLVRPPAFAKKHLRTYQQTYARSPFVDDVMEILTPHYACETIPLAVFNMRLIRSIADYLGISTALATASEMSVGTSRNERLIDLTKAVGGNVYLSGTGAKKYIDGNEMLFEDAGIELVYQRFVHPTYKQFSAAFAPGVSIIDLIANHGPESLEILTSQSGAPFVGWRDRATDG